MKKAIAKKKSMKVSKPMKVAVVSKGMKAAKKVGKKMAKKMYA